MPPLSSPIEPSRDVELVNIPLWIGRNRHTFDIGVQCVQCSAKRLAPHLAEFFPSKVGLSLEFVAVKKFGKELGTENHNSNITTCVFTHSFRVKHVVCSPSKVVLDLILLFPWPV